MKRSVLVAACAVLALSGEARAQTSDPAFATARAQFEEAVAAVRAGRPADAVALFERSYAARAAPVVAVNLAYCLRGLGRFGDARRWYVRFLETATSEDLARHETTVRTHLAEVSRRLAQVTLGERVPSNASVALAGVPMGADTRWIEPGRHDATADALGHVPVALSFVAREGEVVRLSTRLTAQPAVTPITQRWWFWTAVGVAVAGVAVAVLVPTLEPDRSQSPDVMVVRTGTP